MNALMAPASVEELSEAVRAAPQLLAIGSETKKRLSAIEVPKISTSRLRGITEYEPAEFTFSAMAGTPVSEIIETLASKGQHLPFDPVLVKAGSTLGGTVAAGLSGPGRFRYGGLRDFILGIRFVDGAGRVLRMGGKVVKNAAGFDLPKFFVGSLGRFGVLAEITFKVFPKSAGTMTVELQPQTIEATTRILIESARARWELDALDLLPGDQKVCMRLAGSAGVTDQIAKEILSRWPGKVLSAEEAERRWCTLREFSWAKNGGLVKIPLNPNVLLELSRALGTFKDIEMQVSGGGAVAYVSWSDESQAAAINELLCRLKLPAMALQGKGPLWYGSRDATKIAQAIKQALDPDNRFPPLDQ